MTLRLFSIQVAFTGGQANPPTFTFKGINVLIQIRMRKHTWASCFRRRSERSSVRSTRYTPDSCCRLQVQVPRRATNDKDIRHILRTQVLCFRFTLKDIDRTSVLHTGQPEPPCTHTVPMFRTGCAGSTLPELIGHPASSHTGWPELPCANAVPMFRTGCRLNIPVRIGQPASDGRSCPVHVPIFRTGCRLNIPVLIGQPISSHTGRQELPGARTVVPCLGRLQVQLSSLTRPSQPVGASSSAIASWGTHVPSRHRCTALVWLFNLQQNYLSQAAHVGSSLGGEQCDMDLEHRNHHLSDTLCRLTRFYRKMKEF